jgi:hypothetical protein
MLVIVLFRRQMLFYDLCRRVGTPRCSYIPKRTMSSEGFLVSWKAARDTTSRSDS